MNAAAPELDETNAEMVSMLAGLAPLPRLTVSEWADRYRRLPDASAEPGRWRTDRTPYLREPMDLFSAMAGRQEVVVMKGAQLGFSELLNNVVGYSIHQDPCSILMVQPTEATALKYSKKRIGPMIEATPVLRARVSEDKTRSTGNTLLSKEFPAGGFTLVGSNAPSGLASLAARRALLDEVDRFTRNAGGEGDVIALIRARLSTFANWQLGLVSTPTVSGESLIEAAYEDSDQRVYEVPCPHCGVYQQLKWAQIRWPKNNPAAAAYHCEACDAVIPETAKLRMLELGEWVAQNPGHPVAGFFISGLYSPWVPWVQIVAEFVAARGSREKLQAWVNTRLGEAWDPFEADDVLDEQRLVALRELYGPEIPSECVVVTLAVDVQDDRFELEYCGWGLTDESPERWHLDLSILSGDPSAPVIWQDLDRAIGRTFTRRDGRELPVSVTTIDSGGHHTLAVYDFCRAREKRRVYAIKGSTDPKRSPLWPKRPSKTAKGGNCPIYVLGVGVGKSACRGALLATVDRRAPDDGTAPETSGPGLVHWPISAAYTRAYFEQLTAEQLVPKRAHGRVTHVWHLKKGRRNEAFDLDVYGLAAFHAWRALGYTLARTAAAQQRHDPGTSPAQAPPKKTTRQGARRLPDFWRR